MHKLPDGEMQNNTMFYLYKYTLLQPSTFCGFYYYDFCLYFCSQKFIILCKWNFQYLNCSTLGDLCRLAESVTLYASTPHLNSPQLLCERGFHLDPPPQQEKQEKFKIFKKANFIKYLLEYIIKWGIADFL